LLEACGFDGLWVPPCGRAYFLLSTQKKVAKEKATPGSAPGVARFLALLGEPGGLPELACGSKQGKPTAPGPPALLSASQGAR